MALVAGAAPSDGAPPSDGSKPAGLRAALDRHWITLLVLICLALGAIVQYDRRQYMFPDGISYLDMASETLRNGPRSLIHQCWSPLYPALLAALEWVTRPQPALEFPLVQLLNWMVFLAATLAFACFLRSWLRLRGEETNGGGEAGNHRALVLWAFAIFLWSSTSLIEIHCVTPDMCVAALVYLAAAICCRLPRPGARLTHYLALGAVLGVAYYAKTALFPLSVGLLLILLLWPPAGAPGRRGALLATLAFAVVTAPLVAALSAAKGGPTIGEAGKLNYAWYVNRVPHHVGWMGESPTGGRPLHPPRKLNDDPVVLEFARPVPGTYPLWYDPAYWYAGVEVRFDLKGQLAALVVNARYYWRWILLGMSAVCAGLLALALAARGHRTPSLSWAPHWMFLWPLGAFALYALVHVETRYVGAWVVLVSLAAYGALLNRASAQVRTAILITVAVAMLIPVVGRSFGAGARLVRNLAGSGQPAYDVVVAQTLRDHGLRPGDPIAVAGSAFYAYFARLARLRITGQVIYTGTFWSLGPEEILQIQEKLRRTGAKAIVVMEAPARTRVPGWQEIPGPGPDRYTFTLLRP